MTRSEYDSSRRYIECACLRAPAPARREISSVYQYPGKWNIPVGGEVVPSFIQRNIECKTLIFIERILRALPSPPVQREKYLSFLAGFPPTLVRLASSFTPSPFSRHREKLPRIPALRHSRLISNDENRLAVSLRFSPTFPSLSTTTSVSSFAFHRRGSSLGYYGNTISILHTAAAYSRNGNPLRPPHFPPYLHSSLFKRATVGIVFVARALRPYEWLSVPAVVRAP